MQAAVLDYPQRFLSATVTLSAALDVDFIGNIQRAYSGEAHPRGLPSPDRRVLDRLSQRNQPSASLHEELDRRVNEWIALSGRRVTLRPEEFRAWEIPAIAHAGTHRQPANHALTSPLPTERGRELAAVSTPFLVIQGQQDPLNPPPHGRHLAELIPSARLVEIADPGHSLPGAPHDEIIRVIAQHIYRSAAAISHSGSPDASGADAGR